MSMHDISCFIFMFSATVPNDFGHCQQFIASCGTKTKGNCLCLNIKNMYKTHYTNMTIYSSDEIIIMNTSGDHR